mmetsp:Transcript_16980/g.28770  ORF Transcript_16980/g.28770 Transcript_16980/m.28770 type:complete len:1244 (-) Transcript_16980:294-4025(-)
MTETLPFSLGEKCRLDEGHIQFVCDASPKVAFEKYVAFAQNSFFFAHRLFRKGQLKRAYVEFSKFFVFTREKLPNHPSFFDEMYVNSKEWIEDAEKIASKFIDLIVFILENKSKDFDTIDFNNFKYKEYGLELPDWLQKGTNTNGDEGNIDMIDPSRRDHIRKDGGCYRHGVDEEKEQLPSIKEGGSHSSDTSEDATQAVLKLTLASHTMDTTEASTNERRPSFGKLQDHPPISTITGEPLGVIISTAKNDDHFAQPVDPSQSVQQEKSDASSSGGNTPVSAARWNFLRRMMHPKSENTRTGTSSGAGTPTSGNGRSNPGSKTSTPMRLSQAAAANLTDLAHWLRRKGVGSSGSSGSNSIDTPSNSTHGSCANSNTNSGRSTPHLAEEHPPPELANSSSSSADVVVLTSSSGKSERAAATAAGEIVEKPFIRPPAIDISLPRGSNLTTGMNSSSSDQSQKFPGVSIGENHVLRPSPVELSARSTVVIDGSASLTHHVPSEDSAPPLSVDAATPPPAASSAASATGVDDSRPLVDAAAGSTTVSTTGGVPQQQNGSNADVNHSRTRSKSASTSLYAQSFSPKLTIYTEGAGIKESASSSSASSAASSASTSPTSSAVSKSPAMSPVASLQQSKQQYQHQQVYKNARWVPAAAAARVGPRTPPHFAKPPTPPSTPTSYMRSTPKQTLLGQQQQQQQQQQSPAAKSSQDAQAPYNYVKPPTPPYAHAHRFYPTAAPPPAAAVTSALPRSLYNNSSPYAGGATGMYPVPVNDSPSIPQTRQYQFPKPQVQLHGYHHHHYHHHHQQQQQQQQQQPWREVYDQGMPLYSTMAASRTGPAYQHRVFIEGTRIKSPPNGGTSSTTAGVGNSTANVGNVPAPDCVLDPPLGTGTGAPVLPPTHPPSNRPPSNVGYMRDSLSMSHHGHSRDSSLDSEMGYGRGFMGRYSRNTSRTSTPYNTPPHSRNPSFANESATVVNAVALEMMSASWESSAQQPPLSPYKAVFANAMKRRRPAGIKRADIEIMLNYSDYRRFHIAPPSTSTITTQISKSEGYTFRQDDFHTSYAPFLDNLSPELSMTRPAVEFNRCFFIHLGIAMQIHPFALQCAFRHFAAVEMETAEDWEQDIIKTLTDYSGYVDANALAFTWPEEFDKYRLCFISGSVNDPMISCFVPTNRACEVEDLYEIVLRCDGSHFTLLRPFESANDGSEKVKIISKLMEEANKSQRVVQVMDVTSKTGRTIDSVINQMLQNEY